MIYFGFNITNPWCKRWANTWNRVYATPIKHKCIELEMFKDSTILSFSFRLTTRQDHAGLMMDLGILGYSFLFNFYDNRHWNTEEGRWMIYTEELGEH
jgi:hypothetical protein